MDGPFDSADSFSLVVVRNSGDIVLGRKTRGYGAGKLVLPGGKDRYYLGDDGVALIPGIQDAEREVREELGVAIDPSDLRQLGMLHIATEDDNKDVKIFETHAERFPLSNSPELTDVRWHPTDRLPYADMPPDYRLWLPTVLADYAVTAFLKTDEDELLGGTVFRQQLHPLGRMEKVDIGVA